MEETFDLTAPEISLDALRESAKPVAPLGSRLVRGATSGLIINLLTNVFLFVGQLIIPRLLSQGEYAQFTVSISFVTVVALLADLGMTPMFTRLLAEAEEDAASGRADTRGRLLGTMLAIRFSLSVLVSIIVLIAAPVLYGSPMSHYTAILLLTLIISSRLTVLRSVGESVLRSLGRYHIAAFFCLIDAATFAVLLLWGQSAHITLDSVIWIYALCHIPGFTLLTGAVWRWSQREHVHIRVDGALLWGLVKMALPLSLATIFLTLHNEADKLLLDKLSSSLEVANYGATVRLSAAFAPVAVVLGAVTAPELTRLIRRKDLLRARQLIDLSLRVLLVIAGGIALFMTAASSDVIRLLLTSKYAAAAPLLTYVGWMLVPIFFSTFMIEAAIAAGNFKAFTWYTATIMLLVIAGDFLFIPAFGAAGAMTSKLIAVAAGGVLLLALQARSDYFELSRFLVALPKLAIAVFSSLAIAWVLAHAHVNGWLIGAGVLTVYVLAVHFTHLVPWNEARAMVAKLRSR